MVLLIILIMTIFQHCGSCYSVFKFNGRIPSSSSSSPSYATLSSKMVVDLPDQMVFCTSSQQARLSDIHCASVGIYVSRQANLHNPQRRTLKTKEILGLTTGQSIQFWGEMADHGSTQSSGTTQNLSRLMSGHWFKEPFVPETYNPPLKHFPAVGVVGQQMASSWWSSPASPSILVTIHKNEFILV